MLIVATLVFRIYMQYYQHGVKSESDHGSQ